MLISKAAFLFFAVAYCRNLQVYVGRNNSIVFEPSTLRAFPGDTVEFIFAGLNHTVTSGNPFLGCQPDGLINSGFVPVSAPAAAAAPATPPAAPLAPRGLKNVLRKREEAVWLPPPALPGQGDDDAGGLPSFKVPILDFRPLTLYCAQSLHCQNGMVMVINPTQHGATSLARYQSLSAQAGANIAGPVVMGGFLSNAPGAVAGWQVTRSQKSQ